MEIYTHNFKYVENKELLTHLTLMSSEMIKYFHNYKMKHSSFI